MWIIEETPAFRPKSRPINFGVMLSFILPVNADRREEML